MKTTYLFANWKMYLNRTESKTLALEFKKIAATMSPSVSMGVFPSALSFAEVQYMLGDAPVVLGAQYVYWVEKGGYTGEVSAQMYKEAGAMYALVGHSERRHLAGETNHMVRQKMEAALEAALIPVLCVGETQAEHDAGQALEVVEVQLRSALENLAVVANQPVLIVYEPVWAIGTGVSCDPTEVAQMHERVTAFAAALVPQAQIAVLYGGSVRPENVLAFLTQPLVAGVLVGAASVKLDSWLAITEAVSKQS